MHGSCDIPQTGTLVLKRVPSPADFNAVRIEAVRTLDGLHRVFAIRAAVFMAEQSCPFEEEYDGNDLTGLHLLASVGREPVATLRLRWFAGFGKIERVCILPDCRGRKIERILIAHACEIAARKGYRLMIGQIQARLWPLWSRVLKCERREGRAQFSFSGYEYLEIHIPVPPHPEPITPSSDPYVLIRPEGDWDVTGILERSAEASRQGQAA